MDIVVTREGRDRVVLPPALLFRVYWCCHCFTPIRPQQPTPPQASSSTSSLLMKLSKLFRQTKEAKPSVLEQDRPKIWRYFPWNWSNMLCEPCFLKRNDTDTESESAGFYWGREQCLDPLDPPTKTAYDSESVIGFLFESLRRYFDRPSLGVRVFLPDELIANPAALTAHIQRYIPSYKTGQIMNQYVWFTSQSTAEEALRLSTALRHLFGLKENTRVAIVARPVREYIVALLAIMHANLVAVPIHHSFSSPEFQHVLNATRPAAILLAPEFFNTPFKVALQSVLNDQSYHVQLIFYDTLAFPGFHPADITPPSVPVDIRHSMPLPPSTFESLPSSSSSDASSSSPLSPTASSSSSSQLLSCGAELQIGDTCFTAGDGAPCRTWLYNQLVGIGGNDGCESDVFRRFPRSNFENTNSDHLPRSDLSRVVMIIFTSGSTGMPKGVKITGRALLRDVAPAIPGPEQDTRFAYRPLSHMTQLRDCLQVVGAGSRCGFASWFGGEQASLNRIFEELPLVSPSIFQAMPRFWSVVHAMYETEVASLMSQDPSLTVAQARSNLNNGQAFAKKIFGNRLRSVSFGGAVMDPKLRAWLDSAFPMVAEGYGSTETGAIASHGKLVPFLKGYKLRSVPALGYFTTDLPFPRGELLVLTDRFDDDSAHSYFTIDESNPSPSMLDADGYYATGDIVELQPGERVTVIDRCKNTYKLSQSEFVAPEILEGLIGTKLVWLANVYLHCEVSLSTLVAVAVPSPQLFRQFLESEASRGTHQPSEDSISPLSELLAAWPDSNAVPEAVLSSELVASLVLDQVVGFLRQEQRPAYEHPRACILSGEIFTADNGLAVVNGKLNRAKLARHFHDRLQAVLASFASRQSSSSSAVDGPSHRRDGPLSKEQLQAMEFNQVEDIIEELLHTVVAGGKADRKVDLVREGVDSLALHQLHALLQRRFPADTVPTIRRLLEHPTAAGIAQLVLPQAEGGESNDTPVDLFNQDIAQLEEGWPEPLDRRSEETNRTAVLITGATGYIGRYILRHLALTLEDVPIYCIVRAQSDEAAMQRVRDALTATGMPVGGLSSRVTCWTGSLEADRFGLSVERYEQLRQSVHAVYHLASRVNHLLPYALLRQSNVIAMRRVISFCLEGRPKWLHYASTLGVEKSASAIANSASGYLQSKYVGEQCLLKAMQHGLQATSHRFGSVGFDSQTGFFNTSDYICQMIEAVLSSAMPPPSSATSNSRLYLLPVDIAAQQMIALSRGAERGVVQVERVFQLTGQQPLEWTKIVDIARAGFLVNWRHDSSPQGDPVFENAWVRGLMEACPLLAFKTDGKVLMPSQVLPSRLLLSCDKTLAALAVVGQSDSSFSDEALLRFLSCLATKDGKLA